MSEDARRLDELFEEILGKLKPFLLRLPASEESKLCRLWLQRLNRADDQKALRNDYLSEFYKQLKNEYLEKPFDKPPTAGKLMPISCFHRLPPSSSCNDLTETSLSLCEQKRSWPKPRSKSLRRDERTRQPAAITRRRNVISPSSLDEDNTLTSPTVRFHDQDNRHDRNLLRTYKERIDTLTSIVAQLEEQNESLKKTLQHYHETANSDEVSHLQSRIKRLTDEVMALKRKLAEVCEIRTLLEKNHRDVVNEYKKKMTDQFNKMKKQLENARVEKKELQSRINAIELKLQQLNQEKENYTEANEKTWAEQIETIRREYEQMLREKETELKKKDELVQQKEAEIVRKINEIKVLGEKLQELQRLMEVKSQEDMKLQSTLISQYNTIKDELSQMRSNMEAVSQKQNENHEKEISTLKSNLKKLEKQTLKLQQEYEKKVARIIKEKNEAIDDLELRLQSYDMKYSNDSLLSKKQYEIGDLGNNTIGLMYKDFLDTIEHTAVDKRKKYKEKLSFLKESMQRLQHEDHF